MKSAYIFLIISTLSFNEAFAQKEFSAFFNEVDVFLQKHVNNGVINYQAIQKDPNLNRLTDQIRLVNLDQTDTLTQQAFLINAYNVHMLSEVVKKMPLLSNSDSVISPNIPQIEVAGVQYTFDTLNEKLLLLNTNPLFHFALANNGFSFHTLSKAAYRLETLNNQLVEQIKRVVNHPKFMVKSNKVILPYFLKEHHTNFIKKESKKIHFSQYLIKYINQFRSSPMDFDDIMKFKRPLNFANILQIALLDTLQNRRNKLYIPNPMMALGNHEIRAMNSVQRKHVFYSEIERYNSSESYANHSIQYRFGVSTKFNIGMQLNYQFSNAFHSKSAWYGLEEPVTFVAAYTFTEFSDDFPRDPDILTPFGLNFRETGLKNIGPKIWLAPFKNNPNLTIESTLTFPTIMGFDELKNRYFFNHGVSIETHVNYYNYIKKKLLIDLKAGIWVDDIGKYNDRNNKYKNSISLPAQASLYYLPNKIMSVYSSISVSFNTGKIEYFRDDSREINLKSHRGFGSFNRIGLILRCSARVEITASYFKTFYGFSYSSLYQDRNTEEWYKTDWRNEKARIGAGFDLNFIFSF